MKVTIKDRDALCAITMENLLSYLYENEWFEEEKIIRYDREIGIRFTKKNPTIGRTFTVSVIEEGLADYPARMAENFMSIEQCDDISQLQLYADLTKEIIIFEPRSDDGTI